MSTAFRNLDPEILGLMLLRNLIEVTTLGKPFVIIYIYTHALW